LNLVHSYVSSKCRESFCCFHTSKRQFSRLTFAQRQYSALDQRKPSRPRDIAELFNDYFPSIVSGSDKTTQTDNPSSPTDSNLSELILSPDYVLAALLSLDTNKATGPDEIPPRTLKECAHQIAPSLCLLFNKSLRHGSLPEEWKLANIIPIHKKVLERCVLRNLRDYLMFLINSAQHGFIPGRLCLTLAVLFSNGSHRIYMTANSASQFLALLLPKNQCAPVFRKQYLRTNTLPPDDINNLQSWSMSRGLVFNEGKCKSISITRRSQPTHHLYSIKGKELALIPVEKDLGIWIASDLTWSKHILDRCARANKLLGFIKRCSGEISNARTSRTLYLSLVTRA
ncbi:Hypothetical predicted protein, partial [Paramuricea clavata]